MQISNHTISFRFSHWSISFIVITKRKCKYFKRCSSKSVFIILRSSKTAGKLCRVCFQWRRLREEIEYQRDTKFGSGRMFPLPPQAYQAEIAQAVIVWSKLSSVGCTLYIFLYFELFRDASYSRLNVFSLHFWENSLSIKSLLLYWNR